MADIRKFIPILKRWEGGFNNVKDDLGGATNLGITLGTAEHFHIDKDHDGDTDVADVKLIDEGDLMIVVKVGYWDVWKADEIKNQSVANFLVDWLYNSGVAGIKIPQRLLNLKDDGVVGKVTIAAVNAADQAALFSSLVSARHRFIDEIIEHNPTQKKFEKGWRNRVNSFKYQEQ